jgi:hypothetical protein
MALSLSKGQINRFYIQHLRHAAIAGRGFAVEPRYRARPDGRKPLPHSVLGDAPAKLRADLETRMRHLGVLMA